MADLLLDEQAVEPVLDQVRHIRVPQTMRMSHFNGQIGTLPEPGERRVEAFLVDPLLPLDGHNAALAW